MRLRPSFTASLASAIGPSGKVTISARFLGNKALKSKSAPTRTVRVG